MSAPLQPSEPPGEGITRGRDELQGEDEPQFTKSILVPELRSQLNTKAVHLGWIFGAVVPVLYGVIHILSGASPRAWSEGLFLICAGLPCAFFGGLAFGCMALVLQVVLTLLARRLSPRVGAMHRALSEEKDEEDQEEDEVDVLPGNQNGLGGGSGDYFPDYTPPSIDPPTEPGIYPKDRRP
jgi:hypothetical protein